MTDHDSWTRGQQLFYSLLPLYVPEALAPYIIFPIFFLAPNRLGLGSYRIKFTAMDGNNGPIDPKVKDGKHCGSADICDPEITSHREVHR
ncbi:uncharacterized protein EURHEDRAFT_382174 [Aspergillus ruber CBS 135680]|uniref:Uncharacterized protein n=1 Tax=Aspergillus ruber (strain CBS 135680) TaxID=1388766 RepID=A0A017S0T6_ASPRC|nr:uncharacterized protein EURHEDRAFT_382174 [Aspergillus ruber CBS 135680]EYE90244.1 hypothetical protein EURHEDRAFT_382174 [Aspergillus ruber CBS 135680]